jgi:hypothetical protein
LIYRQASWYSKTSFILGLCALFCSTVAFLTFRDPSISRMKDKLIGNAKKKADKQTTIEEDIDKLKLSLLEASEVYIILKKLRKSLHNNNTNTINAARLGVVSFSLNCLSDISIDDDRIIPAIDVINEVLNVPEAKKIIKNSIETPIKDIIDQLINTTQELFAQRKTKKSNKRSYDDDEEEDEDVDDTEPLIKTTTESPFVKFGYKFFMALGLLAMDVEESQNRVGDRGGLSIALSCLQEFHNTNPTMAMWCCWSMIHITFNHPPNKREFVQLGGIIMVFNLTISISKSNNIIDIYR